MANSLRFSIAKNPVKIIQSNIDPGKKYRTSLVVVVIVVVVDAVKESRTRKAQRVV